MHMKCRDCRESLTEAARGVELSAECRLHLQSCAACAGFFDEQMALSRALRSVAAAVPELPGGIESRITAEFKRVYVPAWRWAVAAAIAAGFVSGAWWMLE